MELIYSMRRKPLKCEPPQFESITDTDVARPICTISTGNIIAFSSPTELSDTDGDTWGGHVYVCDIDTPWDSHKVTSTANPISVLEWDIEGKQLLIGTTVGEVSVYGQKEYLLNEWVCLYTANFPGEHIIKSAFFHPGRRIMAVEKKPEVPITERIQMLRSTPTLKGFGGVGCEGACVVTASGLICVLTPPQQAEGALAGGASAQNALTASECLRPTREHVTHAAIAYKNGNLLLACVCGGGGGGGGAVVRCAVGCVSNPGAPVLVLQPLPAIYLDETTSPPSCIAWCSREETDSLLVAGSTLSLWKCTERAHPLHKFLAKGSVQGSSAPAGAPKPTTDCFNTVVWQKAAVWPVEGPAPAACVASSRLPLGAPLTAIATPHSLHLLSRDSHLYLSSKPVASGPGAAPAPPLTPSKKPKYSVGAHAEGGGAAVCCAELSALGGVLVAVDSRAQLHVYKIPQPCPDISPALSVQHITNLLEYSIVSGYDSLDVLLALKPNIIEAVYERLTESFQRQPHSFQQFYYHSWLKLRIALCRSCASLQSSASSLTVLQQCWSAWAAVSPALRPDDKPDAILLQQLLDDHDHDHDKSLVALEAKSEVLVEAHVQLQALRLALQRAADSALTALLSLAHHHHHHHQPHGNVMSAFERFVGVTRSHVFVTHSPATAKWPGEVSVQEGTLHRYEVWADAGAVSLLRRLVLLRGGDALSRLLARLAASAAATAAPKQDLIEECTALGAQAAGPRVWELLPRCAVSAPHAQPFPLYLEYGVEPDALRFTPEPPAYVQTDTTPTLAMDSIRYMQLGGGGRPTRYRHCSRCGGRALPGAQPARHPLQKAYDARFLPACRCGGKWTMFSNI